MCAMHATRLGKTEASLASYELCSRCLNGPYLGVQSGEFEYDFVVYINRRLVAA